MDYCCELFQYSCKIGRITKSKYDNDIYVRCEECMKNEGYPIEYCHFCGTKISPYLKVLIPLHE